MTQASNPFADASRFPMVREVPYIGVAWTVDQASKKGYRGGAADWVNFGQGQPEIGDIPGAPQRIRTAHAEPQDAEYGPIGGLLATREAVADWVNRTWRRGKMPYTAENVSFAAGGRLALTRLFGIFRDGARIGYRNPDYTTYEDYLYAQRGRCALVELRTRAEDGFLLEESAFEAFLNDARPDAFLMSNPCNPTGRAIGTAGLARMLAACRRSGTLLAIDEFYSNYVYNADGTPAAAPLSALAAVEDVNRDPLVVFDGLTKGFRYPGWRAGWAVGPKYLIEMINRAASAIDGGPSTLVQRAVIEALQPGRAEAETKATRAVFAEKRRRMLEGLAELGIRPAAAPEGTFYVWGSLAALPDPINDADRLFERLLEKKMMIVPGHFFDIRPYRTRPVEEPMRAWARFSYGPSAAQLEEGLRRLGEVVREAKAG